MAWAYGGGGYAYIPSSNMYSPEYINQSPYQITVTCQPGYTINSATGQCIPICGDGIKIGSERCDDGNTNNEDGCKGDCTSVETSWVWSGGSPTSRDICTYWSSGFYQNDATNPTVWLTHWGDGLKAGSEKWDDGNTSNNDGWSSDWTSVESNYVWSGGSVNSKDTCSFCSTGFYQNDPLYPTTCITHWGDGIKTSGEKWDDQNNVGGDGWSSDCATIETGWVWSGGSLATKDIWVYWTEGLYQNDATNPTLWVPHWGDGMKAGNEKWDDANTINGDGWSSNWLSIETNYVWSGGSPNTKDTWSFWSSGFYQNDPLNPTTCITHWGDGKRAGNEKWDDANIIDGDGWKGDWSSVEPSWVWSGGNPNSIDAWSFWSSGFYQNDPLNPTTCITHWGDGKRAGNEKWDDANIIDGDGWKGDWSSVEPSWVWSGGNPNSIDAWSFWSSGFYQNDPLNPTTCITHWGDGKRAGDEKWDDGNINDNDGCSSDCLSIDSGWVWSGGTSTTKDTCESWSKGFYPNDVTSPAFCIPHWGDSIKAGNEKWDDGNIKDNDGCKGDWSKVEDQWVCSGGSLYAKDIWSFWNSGFYQNDPLNPTTCITLWGDGKRAGNEKCDDDNEADGDGWSGDCKIIEENYIWLGGSSNLKDICTLCSPGTYPNKEHNFWLPRWGDGLRAGNEKWDDGNTKSGDGCTENCTFVEPSWVWSGGTATSKDNWTYWASGWYQNNPANPEIWVSKWGDGFRVSSEIWDNLNNMNDEGWNSCNEIKEFYIWNGGNDTTADRWKAWSQNFEPNKDKSEWIIKSDTDLMVMVFVFVAITWISTFSLLTFIMNSQARFIDIEYIQKVVLLSLLNVKLIPPFTRFFSYMSYSLLGFQFTG